MSLPNPFNTLQSFSANGASHKFYSLPALEQAGFKVSRLPVSIRLVLESLLRNADGKRVSEQAIRDLAGWNAQGSRTEEIPFVVARIVLQDFTGVPLLVDLAAMRSAVARMGKNPKIIEPLVPVDLVVDHSVQVDFAGNANAYRNNLEIEFSRNRERQGKPRGTNRPIRRPASSGLSCGRFWRRRLPRCPGASHGLSALEVGCGSGWTERPRRRL